MAGAACVAKASDQCAQMIGGQARLVAAHQQHSCRSGRAAVKRAQTGANGTRYALLPSVVENRLRIVIRKDAQIFANWRQAQPAPASTSLFCQAKREFKHGFTLVSEQLFGLAQAAAGPRGKNDSGDWHRHKCNLRLLTPSSEARQNWRNLKTILRLEGQTR